MGITEDVLELERMGVERGWGACRNAASMLVMDLAGELMEGKLAPAQLYSAFKARLSTMEEYFGRAAQADVAGESED